MPRSLLIALFLFPLVAFGQGQADWWYFGSNAGVHFESSGPVAVSNGQLSTSEGCASISDQAGNLLFYTDGITVYDKNHVVMPNGTGLLGNSSSTHSAVIIPRPGSLTDYYIFTVDDGGASGEGMYYSLVDMTLNSGDGDVVTTEKNVFLVDDTSEKIAAVKKSNGYWVITHLASTPTYQAYEITASGVNTTPVVSNTAWATAGFGYGITASSDGQQIASVYFATDSIHLYDFDASTGAVTGNYKIGSSMAQGLMYGLEFSPSGEILYIQAYANGDVRQFDLTLGSSAAVSASETVIGSGTGGGQLQTGPDGYIYCSRYGNLFLSRINDPDVVGVGCNWEDTAVVLTFTARWGLPTFIQSFFNVGFTAEDHCFGDPFAFSLDTLGVDSLLWNFGDPASGTNDTSTTYFPTHTYSDTGTYTVTLIAWGDTLVDTAYSTIYVYPRQTLNIGPADTGMCFSDTITLYATQAYSTYLWQDSSTADSFNVYRDSLIYVTLFGVCDTLTDTMLVHFDTLAVFNLPEDTTFCEGNVLFLDANLQVTADVFWNTGDSVDAITVTQSGFYQMSAVNGCGLVTDSLNVNIIPRPDSALLPPDTLNCFDSPIYLERPLNDTIQWVWSDSSDVEIFEVDTTMTVWLAAFNQCGFLIDTFTAVFNGEIKTELGEDTIICDEDSIRLFGTDSLATYLWNTGDTTDSIWSIPGETENYIVTIKLRECELVESRRVFATDTACPNIDCALRYGNIFTPNGDGWNDRFRIDSDCDLYKFSMAIFNRWGQLVHESSNVAYGWDGYINGEPASQGTYYFTVLYKDFVVVDSDRFLTQGSFMLIRE